MKHILRFTIAVTLMSLIYGCASTSDNLRMETARYIGGDVSPGQVNVSNIDRGATSVTWKAATPTGNYDCWADDMVRKVACARK